jgi:hypothetical protein
MDREKAGFVWDRQQGPTNQTSFQGNMYSNPQMGQYGGGFDPQGAGWFNPSSAQDQWGANFEPAQAHWQGPAPDRHGQQYSFNPVTGQGSWENVAGGLSIGGSNPYGSGAVSWIDPHTGLRAVNPQALMGAFGFESQGGGQYNPYEMTDYSGSQVTAPGAYGGGDWSRPEALDAREVIESYRPLMEAEIGAGFAQAGNRMGQSGMAMSTPYAEALGRVEDLARNKMNMRTLEFGYDAAKFDREQALARQMAENAEKYGAWQTHGGWDLSAQGMNVGNEMQRWMLENQLGFQGNQAQNLYNQNQQNQQNMFLANLLGGLL